MEIAKVAHKERSLFLCRHGHRIDFENPHWYTEHDNPYDPSLSKMGIVQAKVLARRLRGEDIHTLFASPYLRTIETAHYLAETLHLPIFIEPGLGEWLNTEWMEKDPRIGSSEERASLSPYIDLRHQSIFTPVYPETWEQVQQRSASVIPQLLDLSSGNILLVGHGHVLRAILAALTNLPNIDFKPRLCSLTKLDYKDRAWHITIRDNISHLMHFSKKVKK